MAAGGGLPAASSRADQANLPNQPVQRMRRAPFQWMIAGDGPPAVTPPVTDG
jgi:hypothetical protein